ncbi:alkaline phosphatase family protein [Candidatus Kapabacteria bacterium]|nr:alkaline phosphatase family protein [Candidatus Kapabacteria bacterium]
MAFIPLYIIILLSTSLFATTPLIVICLDNVKSSQLSKCEFMSQLALKGVDSPGLEPVFPVKSFPNIISLSTGLYPINHGIIANNFKDFNLGEGFSISDSSTTQNPDWFYGRFIWEWAKQNGRITAGFNWPASNVKSYKRRADISVFANDSSVSDFVLTTLSGETLSNADLIMIYLKNDKLLNYQENTEQFDNLILDYDKKVKDIFTNLYNNDIINFNYLIVSNGGTQDITNGNLISIENELSSFKDIIIQNYGSFLILEGKPKSIKSLGARLGLRDGIKTYLKPNYPKELNYNNSPLTGSALIIADLENLIINKNFDQSSLPIKNANGYLPSNLSMHGIFLAGGPDIKCLKTGTMKIIDLYPLMCDLLDIPLLNNIDSKPERIDFILK